MMLPERLIGKTLDYGELSPSPEEETFELRHQTVRRSQPRGEKEFQVKGTVCAKALWQHKFSI